MPPRPPVIGALLLVLTIASILLLFRPFSATLHGLFVDYSGPGRSLSAWLADEEARYAVVLQERQELIKKVGPKPEDVVS